MVEINSGNDLKELLMYRKKRYFPNMLMHTIHRHMSLCVLTGMRNARHQDR